MNYVMYFCALFLSCVHATFWLVIVQCSNRRPNLVPEESGPRFAWHTYQKPAPEKKWIRVMAQILVCVSWTLRRASVVVHEKNHNGGHVGAS